MTIKEFYAEIIDLSAQNIERQGFKRSGESALFYKYNSDKSKGWVIGFRKSIDNTPEYCKFIIKSGSLDVDDLHNYGSSRDKIRLEYLSVMVMSGYSVTDYSHVLDELVVETQDVNEYFRNSILPEIEKILKQ